MNTKMSFSTKLTFLRLKGSKLLEMSRYTNDVLRDMNGLKDINDRTEFFKRILDKDYQISK
jgi:hypothetical protein